MDQMLKYDHAERITPKDAMDHPYFLPIKNGYQKWMHIWYTKTVEWYNQISNNLQFNKFKNSIQFL